MGSKYKIRRQHFLHFTPLHVAISFFVTHSLPVLEMKSLLMACFGSPPFGGYFINYAWIIATYKKLYLESEILLEFS